MAKIIKRFVRTGKRKGKKIGVLIATIHNNEISVGHSKWNRKVDAYDIKFGEEVAMNRIAAGSTAPPAMSIAKAYIKFVDRAKKYFKESELSAHTEVALLKAHKAIAEMVEAVKLKQPEQ